MPDANDMPDGNEPLRRWGAEVFHTLEALHPDVHAVTGSLSSEPWRGAAGLLISPSRGLLVYSPIVIYALQLFLSF